MPITEQFLLENNFQLNKNGNYILYIATPIHHVKAFIEVGQLQGIKIARMNVMGMWIGNNIKSDAGLRKKIERMDEIVIAEYSKFTSVKS